MNEIFHWIEITIAFAEQKKPNKKIKKMVISHTTL